MVPPVKVLFQEGWSERQPALAPRPLSWSFTVTQNTWPRPCSSA